MSSVLISGNDSGGIRLQNRDGCTRCPVGGPETASLTVPQAPARHQQCHPPAPKSKVSEAEGPGLTESP